MTDLYDHLFPAYREQAGLSDDERIDWLRRDRWLSLPQSEAALGRLEDLLTYPPRGRMPCLLLFGSTGMGKSEILNRFAELHATRYDKNAGLTIMPVVMVQMPPQPTEEEFYTELMLAMNYSEFDHISLRSLRSLARRTLGEFGTKVLVLDEIDKMLAGSPRQQRIFLNTIRFLTNDLKFRSCARARKMRVSRSSPIPISPTASPHSSFHPGATITPCASSWRASPVCSPCAALPCSMKLRSASASSH
jgi:Cdc6-like AAA superfamily ATPase